MKTKNLILICALFTGLFVGCKKEDNNPEPVDQFANVFLTEKIVTYVNSTDEPGHIYYTYDSLGRITASDDLKFYYNPDGTLNKIVQTWGDSILYRYNSAKQLSRLIIDDYPISKIDTVDLFYTNGVKPDHSTGTNYETTSRYSYGQDGMIDTLWSSSKYLSIRYAYQWQNGNIQKIELTQADDPLLYDTDVFEYDSKPNYALTMHFPKEFMLSVELTLALDFTTWLLPKNNVVRHTYHDQYNNVTNTYISTVIEYNDLGLPAKIDQGDKVIELLYETRN